MAQDTWGTLLNIAEQRVEKAAVVDAASLAGGGGGDPAAMGMDPAAMGGDPMAAAGGGDPMAAGGGPDPMEQRLAALEAQLAAGGGAGGAAGGVEPIKPKIDVNVEIMQMKKILARIADSMGVQIPAAEMVATPDDLTQMGMQEDQLGGGAAGGAGASAIQPPDAMGAASPELAKGAHHTGEAYDGSGSAFEGISDEASALLSIMEMRGK
jgi:hypothetical protein